MTNKDIRFANEVEIYSEDKEREKGIPDKIKRLYSKIGSSDLIIISFAEHNGSYTSAYKNIFDWLSRINQGVFQGKDLVYLSASIGEMGATSVLDQAVRSVSYFNGNLILSHSLPSVSKDNFNDIGELVINQNIIDEILNKINKEIFI